MRVFEGTGLEGDPAAGNTLWSFFLRIGFVLFSANLKFWKKTLKNQRMVQR